MKEWQKKVVAEKYELDVRISKLRDYIESSQYDVLCRQLVVMSEYTDILKRRIDQFLE